MFANTLQTYEETNIYKVNNASVYVSVTLLYKHNA